jgi:hypothetical protein
MVGLCRFDWGWPSWTRSQDSLSSQTQRWSASAVRVSEQEARFIMAGELAKAGLLYSIETPTTKPYQFTGCSELSGQTDLTIYWPSAKDILWNIEFKAHGFTKAQKQKLPIQKDIEKLLCEPAQGFWFHTLEGVNNSTLTVVWQAFASYIEFVAKENIRKLRPKTLVFHACVLKHQFSVERTLTIVPSASDFGSVLVSAPVYSVTHSKLKSCEQLEGWTFRQ